MTQRRIVVLGAAGFIGRRVVEALRRDPRNLAVAAVRGASAGPVPQDVEVVRLDATDARDLGAALVGAAGVVNCVAGSAATITAGAQALTHALAARSEPPRLVHLSSLAVYGTASGTVDETSPLRGDLDDYSAAKAAAERTLQALGDVVMLRPGIVYGPGSPLWSEYLGRLLVARRLGALGPRGEGVCNLAYVDDVVAAVMRALDTPGIEGRAFNIASNTPPTWNEYFRDYALALGAAPARIGGLRLAVETYLVSPVLKAAEMASRSAALPPAIRPWLLARCRHCITMDVHLAERCLAMHWLPHAEGLRATAKWFRDARGR